MSATLTSTSTAEAVRDVRVAACTIVPEARVAADRVLAGGWVTAGAETAAFERELAAWVGARDVVAVSSCTAAIELALRALDLPARAAVLTPTLTFCGAVAAIVHAGLRPVLLDVDEYTLLPGPAEVARAARTTTPAAMVVQHMAGHPAPVPELAAAAGLSLTHVVEDAAHGLGARVAADSTTRAVGTVSAQTCFSFYATKNLPIGEGGAIATGDAALADRHRVLRQHGMSRDAWARYMPGGAARYDVTEDGLKANFTDLQAAIGRAQLAHLDEWQSRRGALAAAYDHALAGVTGLVRPARPVTGTHAWHLYVVRVTPTFGMGRDALATALAAAGVGTSVHFTPVHHLTWFRRALADRPPLPVADRIADELLSLPLHPALHDDDVAHVAAVVRRCRRSAGGR